METAQEKGLETLRELIIINNDRFEGYKTAAKETNDAGFKSLFAEFSLQSKRFGDELRKLIPPEEESPARDETKVFGDFYRSWMGMKTALTENDNKAILLSCEYGEDVIKKTYDDIMKDPEISPEILKSIKKQRDELEQSADLVKAKRKAT